MEKNILTSAL